MFNFEKLDVWNEAIAFAALICKLSDGFPSEERFGLTNQIRRAAVFLPSNIAEGSSRRSRPDFARFAEIGTGSLFEVVTQSVIAHRRGWIDQSTFATLYASAQKPSRMLSGLRHSLLNA